MKTPKCSCTPWAVHLWCRAHNPQNRVKVRWNQEAGRHEWLDKHGQWMNLYGDIGIARVVAESRAERSHPAAYLAWKNERL